MRRLALACLCLVLTCFAGRVETASAALTKCTPQPTARVKVILTTTPLRADNSKSEKELAQFHIDTINPYGPKADTEVGGLMSGGLQLKSDVELAWETDRVNACFWYKTVNVIMNIDPMIYIASRHKPGTCMYNAVMQHELKHVRADRDVAMYWRPKLQAYLQAQVDRVGVLGPYPMAQQVAARAKMTEYIKAAMEQSGRPVNEDRQQRQQAIDNRDEYERVNKMCR